MTKTILKVPVIQTKFGYKKTPKKDIKFIDEKNLQQSEDVYEFSEEAIWHTLEQEMLRFFDVPWYTNTMSDGGLMLQFLVLIFAGIVHQSLSFDEFWRFFDEFCRVFDEV